MPEPTLPPAQARIYWAMIDHREAHGVWPTLQEIADQLGRGKITTLETTHRMLAKGVVVQAKAKTARCYSVAPKHMPEPLTMRIPVTGTIKAEAMR
jgi:SOS-response transcriptional repressor LexA